MRPDDIVIAVKTGRQEDAFILKAFGGVPLQLPYKLIHYGVGRTIVCIGGC